VSDKKDTQKAPKMCEIGKVTQGLGRVPKEIAVHADIAHDPENQGLTAETRRTARIGYKQE
jgi:hypothetical protein